MSKKMFLTIETVPNDHRIRRLHERILKEGYLAYLHDEAPVMFHKPTRIKPTDIGHRNPKKMKHVVPGRTMPELIVDYILLHAGAFGVNRDVVVSEFSKRTPEGQFQPDAVKAVLRRMVQVGIITLRKNDKQLFVTKPVPTGTDIRERMKRKKKKHADLNQPAML